MSNKRKNINQIDQPIIKIQKLNEKASKEGSENELECDALNIQDTEGSKSDKACENELQDKDDDEINKQEKQKNIQTFLSDLLFLFQFIVATKKDKEYDPVTDIIELLSCDKKEKQNLLDSVKDLMNRYQPQKQISGQLEQILFDVLSQLQLNESKIYINYIQTIKYNLQILDQVNQEQDLIENIGKSIKLMQSQSINHNQIIKSYNLSELNVLTCPKKCFYQSFQGKKFSLKKYIQYNDNKITFISGNEDEAQYYFDFAIEFEKKYTLLLQFDDNPREKFTIGVQQENLLLQRVAYDEPNSFFSKTFFPNWAVGDNDCSNIIKGSELSCQPKIGSMIEIRISLSDNLIEFTDYPKRENINSNYQNYELSASKNRYVIGLNLCNQQQVSILQIQEVSHFIY